MVVELGTAASLALSAIGWKFFVTQGWNPVLDRFGALAFIYGTLVSSLLALAIAAPFGIGIALFLTEISPKSIREPVSFLVEMLAAIPSVVYGLWGIFVLAPFMRTHVDPLLIGAFGKPLFAPPSTGLSLLSASLILAIMILPTIMGVSREVFRTVPRGMRDAALALGATGWETIRVAVLSPSRAGLTGAMLLGVGRALGETMAVTMVIGNRPEISANFLGPSHTIAAVIANEFAEAASDVHLSALSALGLALMGITVLVNIAARVLVWTTSLRIAPRGGAA
jgi:phosphate transport system permease protein